MKQVCLAQDGLPREAGQEGAVAGEAEPRRRFHARGFAAEPR